MNRYSLLLVAVTVLLALSGCSDAPQGPSATPGDHAALEKLADAYRDVSDALTSNPRNQTPEQKRDFVEEVFRQAGYSYHATLMALSTTSFDRSDTEHKDLAELVLFPATGYADSDAAKIYSETEVKALNAIRDKLR
jgi:hypothetical protein